MRFPEELMDVYNKYDLFVSGDVNGESAWDIIKGIEARFHVDDIMLKDGTRIWNLIRIFIYTFYQESSGKRDVDLFSFLRELSWKAVYHRVLHKHCEIQGEDILSGVVDFIAGSSGVDKKIVTRSIYDYIIVFKDMKEYYKQRLACSGEHEVVLQGCGYGRLPMARAQACRELGIRCVEKQHGVIDEYFPAYVRASSTRNHDCVPEYLLTYDELFTSIVRKGHLFEPDKVRTVGYPAIKKHILVSSQWILADEIQDFVVNLATILPDKYLILFQPHSLDSRSYDDLERDNIVLVDKDMDIEVLFRSVDVHATVFSGRGYYANVYDVPSFYIDVCDIVTVDSPFVVKTPEEFVEELEKIV
jgi:hypothetical protein